MKKLNWQYMPAFIVAILAVFLGEPKPWASFYGVNWVMVSLTFIWFVLIVFPLFRTK